MTIFGTSVLASFFTKGCFSSVPKTQLGNICDILLQQTSKDLQNLYWGGSKRFFFFTSLEPNCLRHFLCVSTVLLWLNHAANSLHVVYLFVSPLPQTCSGHLVVFSGRLNLLTSASNKKKLLGIHRQFEQSCQHAGCWQTPYWTYYSQHSFPWLNSKKTHFPGESNPPSLSALI